MVSRCGATSARSALAVPLELSDLPGISDHLLVPGKRNDLVGRWINGDLHEFQLEQGLCVGAVIA